MTSFSPTRRGIVRAAVALLFFFGTCAPALAQGARRPSRRGAANASRRPAARQTITPARRAALEQIRPESLRAHLSFLASDALEGRATGSRGLDVAAEYIAAQFRRAGLAPAGDDGYFQTANWETAGREPDYRLDIQTAAGGFNFGPQRSTLGASAGGLTLWAPAPGLALQRAGVVKIPYGDAAALSALTREQVEGRAVVTEMPPFAGEGRERAFALLRERHDFLTRLRALGASLVVSFDRASETGRGSPAPRLVDPENPPRAASPFGGEAAPLVTVHGAEAAKFYDALPAGATAASISFRAPAVLSTPVKVRNVAGLLRGSDPRLRDEYVIVSAHYDHIGVKPDCRAGEDCVYNGANDNGSGTTVVIELASALSALKVRPKRSVLFLTFFGEERGLLGSRYYGRRPLVPLAATIAQVNLEQIGRTDDSEGPQVSSYALTGFDFSDVGAALQAAGAGAGVRVFKHPTNSDAFFSRSDNQALADLGVPAHTASTAYEFPDYHGVEDEWEKIDYANMARVLRAVGAGVLRLADAAGRPRWNESNPKTAKYVEAWRRLRGPDQSREGNDE